MMLLQWEELPSQMQTEEVRKYYDIIAKKNISLISKRIFDVFCSLILLVVFSPLFLVLAIAIKCDSSGNVIFSQERVTQYGKTFRILKFRTMVQNADKIGSLITGDSDLRITRVGKLIRKFRLDELPQLINVLLGDMSFVGTRPEVKKYVDGYTPDMMATLLLPAGITSLASIYYKDEADLLKDAEDIDKVYIQEILPSKMYFNLKSIENFRFFEDIKVMFMTFFAVCGKKYKAQAVTAAQEKKEVKV